MLSGASGHIECHQSIIKYRFPASVPLTLNGHMSRFMKTVLFSGYKNRLETVQPPGGAGDHIYYHHPTAWPCLSVSVQYMFSH